MSRLSLYSKVDLENSSNNLHGQKHRTGHFFEADSRTLIDHYVDGELGIHVQLRTRNPVSNLEIREFLIVFQNMPVRREVAVFKRHSNRNYHSQVTTNDDCADQMQPSMPIHPSPVIENN